MLSACSCASVCVWSCVISRSTTSKKCGGGHRLGNKPPPRQAVPSWQDERWLPVAQCTARYGDRSNASASRKHRQCPSAVDAPAESSVAPGLRASSSTVRARRSAAAAAPRVKRDGERTLGLRSLSRARSPNLGGAAPRATNENGVAVRAAGRVKCEDGDNCPGLTSEVPPARCFLSSRPDPGRGQRRCGGGTLPSGCVFYSVGFCCRPVVTRERAHSF